MRLKELQSHGKEISELKRSKSELVALFKQLEHTVAEKDLEIRRLHHQYKDLIQMVKLSMSNKLITTSN